MYQRKHSHKFLIIPFLILCLVLPGCSSSGFPAFWQSDEAKAKEQQQFDEFTNELFVDALKGNTINMHYMLSDPAAYGITDYEVHFGEFTLENMQQSALETKELQETLEDFHFDYLTKEQQLTYELLEYNIETELLSEGMELYYNPVTAYTGIQAELPTLLSEYIFYTKQDVEDYLLLLSQIDEYFGQIVEFERLKSEAGLFMSDGSADRVIESCEAYLTDPEESFLTASFNERLAGLKDVSSEEAAAYEKRHLTILKEDFIPAYELLIAGLKELKGSGTNENGLYYFPDGTKYFEYLLQSNIGTSYSSIDKLSDAIERNINRDLREIYLLLEENPELSSMYSDYSFSLTEPDEILTDLQEQIKKYFPEIPDNTFTIKYVPESQKDILSPAFYLVPPIDRVQDNTIYINDSEKNAGLDLYPMLAHEGYPGHMYQTNYFRSNGLAPLRSLLSSSGYMEGWAVYAELMSYDFDNGLEPALAEILALNESITLELSALLDIHINYFGLDMEDTSLYLVENYGYDEESSENIYYMIVDNPGYYLEYYTGYLEISNMRKKAESKLRDDFNLKEFHTFLLDLGPMPFSIIREHFDNDYFIN